MGNSKVVIEVGENDKAVIFIRNLEPYDSVRLLMTMALALFEGRAEVTFNDGPPLTEEEEREIIDSLIEGTSGGQRDN